MQTRLPMGIENFKTMRTDGYYYVDKTGFIRDLLQNMAYVNLFTRPRRFGKTLNMSMLRYFFELGSDSTIFDGLEIAKEKELCEEYMGKFPVISISLKEVAGESFDRAKRILRSVLGDEAVRFPFLAESDKLTETERWQYKKLIVYCPWDVVSYCHALKMEPSTEPQNYWVNTSSNDIIRNFLSKAKTADRNEIEQLINGNSIQKMIRQELTYRDLDSDPDNLWSILFTTGYLTQRSAQTGDLTELVIPNREIQWIFIRQIREWFKKENFYHGILLGLFGNMDGWDVQSNAESGDGYSDISIEIEDQETGIIIELKYAEKAAFDTACREALKQINDRNYEEKLIDDGMTIIRKYGIACYKRRCKVISG